MYSAVEITLNAKKGKALSFRYEYDNEIVAKIALSQSSVETCTNIQELMKAIDNGVVSDDELEDTLSEVIKEFNETEEQMYEMMGDISPLKEYDQFVQSALKTFEDFSKLKSVVIEIFDCDSDERLNRVELKF